MLETLVLALNSIGKLAAIPSCNPELAQKGKRNCNVPGFRYRPLSYPHSWHYDAPPPGARTPL